MISLWLDSVSVMFFSIGTHNEFGAENPLGSNWPSGSSSKWILEKQGR